MPGFGFGFGEGEFFNGLSAAATGGDEQDFDHGNQLPAKEAVSYFRITAF